MTALQTPAASRRQGSARLAVALLLLTTILGVARTQPRLAATAHQVKERDDVWVLPPPDDLRAATLGYTAAATDLLWAKLLVEYGIHMAEHRAFPSLSFYVDSIIGLEPDFAPIYRYVDTMFVYRPGHATEDDARAARRYLERGLVERPLDHHVWLQYGQFVAFLGPTWLSQETEKEQWRRDGAQALMRAVELGADADRSLAAAAMLKRWGKGDAARRYLHQMFALANDDNTRNEIAQQLRSLNSTEEQDSAERTVHSVESEWRRDMPFVPRGDFLLLGPVPQAAACAGLARSGEPACAHAWEEALTDIP
jgi:hypothetical protein